MAAPESTPDVDGWEPIHLQLIAFPTIPATDISQSWWQDLAGGEPEESVRKRNERTDKGRFQGRSLVVATDILRISWTVAPYVEPDEYLENPIPTLGRLTDACDWFVNLMGRWLCQNPPPLKRLAFAGRFARRVDDHAAAYRLLQRILKFDLDDESTDFLYRINRKRPSQSGIPNLLINRLMTWSAVKALTQVQLPGADSGQQARPFFACFLDVDINTAHEFTQELPSNRLPDLFRELVQLGVEVARRGDVR